MAAGEIAVKKYAVRLDEAERNHLQASIGKGKSPAKRLPKARILLKGDAPEHGEGSSDGRIVEALDTDLSMVTRVGQQFVEEGLEAVLSRKQRNPRDNARLRRRERGPADSLGLLHPSRRPRALELAALGGQGCGTGHRCACQRQDDRARS